MSLVKCLLSAITVGLILKLIFTLAMINSYNINWDNATISLNRSRTFDMYLKRFNKTYSDDEYQVRLLYFRESMREIYQMNSLTGAHHGWTKFSDMSKQEFANMMLRRSYSECAPMYEQCKADVNETVIPDDKPDSVDWRSKGAVGPILDQLRCGCCWAISVVGTLESMAVIQGFGYQQLSVQELIDCSRYNNGCSGGSMTVLEYLCRHKLALTTEENYPLKLVQGKCWSRNYRGIRRLRQFRVTCDMNEDYLIRVLAHHGPVVVVVNAGPLMSYTDGIIQRACRRSHDGLSEDHMVQIVGYNLAGSVPYYIVKNSWGSDYGEDGYFRLAIGKNMCGLADEVAYLDVY